MSKRRLLGLMLVVAASGLSASPSSSALDHSDAASVRSKRLQLAKHATTAPTTAPALAGASTKPSASTQPVAWSPPNLAGDFAIMNSRNIFLHGRPPAAKAPSTAPSFSKPPSGPSVVLRGVARQGEHVLAMVEDLSARTTRRLKIGDMIGDGKVVAITTDGFDSSIKGKISHVKIGQNIDSKPAPATQPAVVVQDGSVSPTTAPVVAEQAGNPELPVAAGAKLLPERVINK